jgi:hypothetical protein
VAAAAGVGLPPLTSASPAILAGERLWNGLSAAPSICSRGDGGSRSMNAMKLQIFVGTKKMCMFYEPAGFWLNIVYTFVWEHSKVTLLYLGRPQPAPLVQ